MTDHVSPNAHIVRAKQPESDRIRKQLEDWMAKGNLPQLLPTQPEKSK